jgi:DnaD/phage-associated family protein
MKSSDILKSTNFTYNNLFIKKILEYDLSLHEFLLLNYFINYNVEELNINEIKKHTSLSNDMILNAYNGLITKKIIKIITSDKDGVIFESISLDDFYEKIDQSIKQENKTSSFDDIIKVFEESSTEKVTDLEKEVINAWIQSGYDSSMIINAINEAKYNGTCNIRYIDKVLNEWGENGIKNTDQLENYYKESSTNDKKVELFDYNWLDEDK